MFLLLNVCVFFVLFLCYCILWSYQKSVEFQSISYGILQNPIESYRFLQHIYGIPQNLYEIHVEFFLEFYRVLSSSIEFLQGSIDQFKCIFFMSYVFVVVVLYMFEFFVIIFLFSLLCSFSNSIELYSEISYIPKKNPNIQKVQTI